MFNYELVTAGERLCRFVFDHAIPSDAWERFEGKHLTITARGNQFRHYFQEALAINITGWLLLGAKRIGQQFEPNEAGFLQYLGSLIEDWGFASLNRTGALARLSREAFIASRREISDNLRRRLLHWAQREHPCCYLCGVSLDFVARTSVHSIALDHLWPRSHGGDSIEENLLPACVSCNSKKKQSYPSWAALGVHAFMISSDPSENELRGVPGPLRFALYNRSVTVLANEKRITLKHAYQRLRHWTSDPWVLNSDEAGDFFNVRIHQLNLPHEHPYV